MLRSGASRAESLDLYAHRDQGAFLAFGLDHHVGLFAPEGIYELLPVREVHGVGVGTGLLLGVLAREV